MQPVSKNIKEYSLSGLKVLVFFVNKENKRYNKNKMTCKCYHWHHRVCVYTCNTCTKQRQHKEPYESNCFSNDKDKWPDLVGPPQMRC